MSRSTTGVVRATVVAVLVMTGCSTAPPAALQPAPPTPAATVLSAAEFEALHRARTDSARMRFTPADVRFMTGMIGHHAQALVMSALAPTRDASPSIRTLAARIISSQQDEIATMQRWLPEQAAIVSSPRIFADLTEPARHGMAPEDKAEIERARARGAFIIDVQGESHVLSPRMTGPMLDSIMKARGGTGAPTAADSATLRSELPAMVAHMMGARQAATPGPRPGPTQCHDITVYPALGLAGGACEGYGLLLDISNPVDPKRLAAVADSNFSYWHSATFNNDGTKLLFSDEWGGGGQPKCRATDPKEWGADAIFTVRNRQLEFASYYKLPAVQTSLENCVAHNGSMIPIPGRDVMVQAWYQGGISVFDFTDAAQPVEIAFFDRGPSDSTRMRPGGSWSAYWYNGVIVSSEIARGLDILELAPNAMLTQNEIDAAKSVKLDYFNTQEQVPFVWPATFALARAYLDQLERSRGLAAARIAEVREELAEVEKAAGASRGAALLTLATRLEGEAAAAGDGAKVRLLATSVRNLAGATP